MKPRANQAHPRYPDIHEVMPMAKTSGRKKREYNGADKLGLSRRTNHSWWPRIYDAHKSVHQ